MGPANLATPLNFKGIVWEFFVGGLGVQIPTQCFMVNEGLPCKPN